MQPAVTVSIAEASAISSLSVRTLYRLIDRGEIESLTIGRRRLIRRDSLMRLIGGDVHGAA